MFMSLSGCGAGHDSFCMIAMPREGSGPQYLDERVALVTGSSAGIGLAVAQKLAADGASVVVNSRSQERADAAAAAVGGDRVIALAADVGDPASVQELVDRTVESFGRLDILVNNAGQSNAIPTTELAVEDWQRVLQLNLTGPFLCAQAAGRVMLAAGAGVIINLGSIWGHAGLPGRVAYASTKHAITGMTKVLASEWGPHGLRVLSVDPGYTETELVSQLLSSGAVDEKSILARTPSRRLAQPSEIAEMVAFMASDRAGFVNGSSVLVDGGWTAYGGW
jgi:NAD(P)-dependent dehydrogenase (short-subunit alcohol dehydrogenase family)